MTHSVRIDLLRPRCVHVLTLLVVVGWVTTAPDLMHAQVLTPADAPFGLTYSYAVFAPEDGQIASTVDFSYSYNPTGISYRNGIGALILEFVLTERESGERLTFLIRNDVRELDSLDESVQYSHLGKLDVMPGEYDVVLKVIDAVDPTRTDSVDFPMYVMDFSRTIPLISDIELTTEMAPADSTPDQFARNGYVIVRNIPGLVVAHSNHYLYTYLELYNLEMIRGDSATLSWLVATENGVGVYRRNELVGRTTHEGQFATNSLNVDNLPSGRYIVAARLYNARRELASDSVQSIRMFYVYNPVVDSLARQPDSVDTWAGIEIDPYYAGLNEKELDRQFAMASYIVSPAGRNIWSKLSGTEAKGRFLTRFWASVDNDSQTPENPIKEDYFRRVELASKLYRSAQSPEGWDSDRGRVLLTYGPPDGIDRHMNDNNRKPYEVWTYSSYGYTFVFVDKAQTDSFVLVHSTAPNEIRYTDWERDYATLHKQMYNDADDF